MFVRKFPTPFRACETEAGQAAIDAHALEILEQELRDAASDVVHATRDPTCELADRLAHDASDRCAREYEAYALKSLETGEETIARQCAEVVAAAEAERDRYAANLEAEPRPIASRRAKLSEAGMAATAPHTADAVLARLKSRLTPS